MNKDRELKSYEDACEKAAEQTEQEGELYIGVDRGKNVWPRYTTMRAPQIGDEISFAFNGDYYPCGTIVKISKTMKKITSSEGDFFYRNKLSGQWLKNGRTWSMVRGHIDKRNPSF